MFLLSLGWGASIVVGPTLLVAIAIPIAQASISARHAKFIAMKRNRAWSLIGLRFVVLFLHLMQPMARLSRRMRSGLTPWRRRGPKTRPRFRRVQMTYWRDQREAPEETLTKLQAQLLDSGAIVRPGGEFDPWDLEVRGGALGGSRLLLAVEEHAPGKQLLRFRIRPVYAKSAAALGAGFVLMSIAALVSGAWVAGVTAAAIAALAVARAFSDTGFAGGILRERLDRFGAT